MKLKKSIVAITLYIAVLFLTYYLHITYFKINVVFYSAIFDGIFASIVTSILIYKLKLFNILEDFEKFLLTIIFVLGGYIYAISVPTVIDRSLSFYILEKIQERGKGVKGIKQEAFKDVFIKEYLPEHRLVDVRLTEQLQSGTIKIEHGCVKLTDKGKKLVKFSRYFRTHFLPKKRLLMGKYSDDLTDPFNHGAVKDKDFDYICE